MPLSTAQSLGWNLARTMMTIIVLVETSAGYSVMPLIIVSGQRPCNLTVRFGVAGCESKSGIIA